VLERHAEIEIESLPEIRCLRVALRKCSTPLPPARRGLLGTLGERVPAPRAVTQRAPPLRGRPRPPLLA
jgi:hypothetical protein